MLDRITIVMTNLTEEEQVKLLFELGRFAGKELPFEKDLIIIPGKIISGENK